MAELRWEVLYGQVTATAGNAEQEFRNETSRILHIRRVRESHKAVTIAPGEVVELELSKAPAFQSKTDESPFYVLPSKLAGNPTGATPADGAVAYNAEVLYGRGHLTLEPNESVFVNYIQPADPTTDFCYVIAYEF